MSCPSEPGSDANEPKTDANEHNFVWGDKLQHDSSLPHSKSPALEFQVKAVDGHARSAQMQLPHWCAPEIQLTSRRVCKDAHGHAWSCRALTS
jgi:hypothetical protein